jgi:hypothetical protein
MEPLDVFKQIHSCLVLSTETSVMYSLSLQHSKKSFTGGIIITVANGTYAAHQAIAAQIALIITAGELGTFV